MRNENFRFNPTMDEGKLSFFIFLLPEFLQHKSNRKFIAQRQNPKDIWDYLYRFTFSGHPGTAATSSKVNK
jgi:hypothetical protein